MNGKNQASDELGLKLVLMLLANSDALAGAHQRLPADAEILYQQLVVALHKEVVLLTSATGRQEAWHKDNIAYIKAELSSLDAVSKIDMCRTTVKVLNKIVMAAFEIALATV